MAKCKNDDSTERNIVEINTTKKDTYYLSKKSSTVKLFDSIGTFYNWNEKKHPKIIEIDIINPVKQFSITKCKFSKDKREFEIHVECVKEVNTSLYYKYIEAEKEEFDLPPNIDGKCVTVNFIIYNHDPCDQEKYYVEFGKPTQNELKFWEDNDGSDCEDNAAREIANKKYDIQPKTKKGNIIVGNP